MARFQNSERGATLIELMIGMLVLATGLGALTILFAGSMATDNKNSKDTSATLLAQKVIEELSAQNTNSTVTVTLTDCAGNTWTIPSTQRTAFPAQGAAVNNNPASPFYGGINFTQSLGSVPAGFSMQYVLHIGKERDPLAQLRKSYRAFTGRNAKLKELPHRVRWSRLRPLLTLV